MIKKALEMFSEIIERKGLAIERSSTFYWVMAYFQRAACYKKLGNKEKAREDLQSFLELWKNADTETDEIKRAIALMKSSR